MWHDAQPRYFQLHLSIEAPFAKELECALEEGSASVLLGNTGMYFA